MLRRFHKGVDRLNRAVGLFIGGLLLIVMLSLARETVGRYFFNLPTRWVIELDSYLLVAVVFLGAGYALLLDAHVRIDIFYRRYSPKTRAWVDIFTYLMVLAYAGLIGWQGGKMAYNAFLKGHTSTDMRWPLFLPQAMLPLGASLLSIQAISKLVRALGAFKE